MAPASTLRTFFKEHRHLRRLSMAAVVAVGLYTLLGFLLVPALARSIGQRKLSELLHRQVTIAEVRLNPYALSATVRGLRIRDRESASDLFSLTEVYVNLGIASLFKGGVVVQQVSVVEPSVNLVRTAEDRTSVSDLIDEFSSGPKTPPASSSESKPTRFSVSNIQLFNGRVTVDDRWKQTRHEIAGINVGVPFVSNFPYLVETFVQPAFSAVINGTQLAIVGRTKPFADSLESSITVELRKIDLPYYLAYVPLKLRMKLRSAVLDTKLNVTFVQYRDRPPRIDVGGGVVLSAVDVVDDRDRPLLKFPSLDIAIASSDLLSNKLSLRHVILSSLALHVRRDRQGQLQVQSLVVEPDHTEKPAAPTAPQPKQDAKAKVGAPWLVQVEELRLDDARIAFADASNAQPFETVIAPLSVKVKHFTTARNGRSDVAVSLSTDAHEQLTVQGKLGIEPLAFDGTVALKDLSLPHLAPYYASQILFDIRDGKLDLTLPLHVAQKGEQLDVTVADLVTELRGLQLRRRGDRDDFLRLPSLAVRATEFDLGRRQLVLGEISTTDARLRLERPGRDQPWNLETLVPGAPPAKAAAAHPAPTPPASQGADQPFAVTVNRLDLKGWSARVEDRAVSTPAVNQVDRIALHVEGLATARGKMGRINLQARVNQTGTLAIQGTLGLSPVQANLQVQLKTIPVIPVQPYFQDRTTMLLTSGQVGIDGRVALSTTAQGPVVTYKGEVSAGNFVAVERDGGHELGRLGELRMSGIDLVSEPLKVDIAEIAVRGYAANVILQPDKTINLAPLVPPPTSPPALAGPQPVPKTAPAPAPSPPPPVRIGALVLSDGTVNFEDRSITPAFSTSLSQLGGRISGIAMDEATRAVVALEGKLGSGPLAIAGQVNPFAKQPAIDLTFKLSDLDLSAMTPYSGKYAGYAVERGQLYLDLKYQIEARRLDAQNNVKISQFTFGQSVESKDATKLPVRLAVSLLKDRHGVIQLDVPVSGSLDDPKFSVWGVVWTVVKNLLIKAATSPFALIGSLFGGGEELAWLEFEPGQFEVAPGARSKIESLSKAMYERPALRLEVEGHASPTQDTEALRRMQLQRKVAAQKAKEIVAAGGAVDSAVAISPAEYPTYLKQAYQAEPAINKPRNALGMLKDIPVAEMERLMLGAITVSHDDLRLLARRRAQIARDEILKKRGIETERIFLVEPRSIAPVHADKVRDSRVDFRLQ